MGMEYNLRVFWICLNNILKGDFFCLVLEILLVFCLFVWGNSIKCVDL